MHLPHKSLLKEADMDLSSNIAGVIFKNPVSASSGVITRSVYGMRKSIEAGAGSVATKSITFIPESWPLPRPSCFMLDKYGNPGSCTDIELGFFTPDQGVKIIKQIKPFTKAEGVVLIGNISISSDIAFFSKEEILERTVDLVKNLVEAGSDVIELMRLCSIAIGKELAGDWSKLKDFELLENLVKTLKAEISVPVILRIPYLDVIENVQGFDAAGADAYSFSSGMFGTVIDIENGRPVVPYSRPVHGQACKAFQNHQVATLAKKTKTPIIPSGGLATSRDIIESLMCGATNCQVQTAVMRHGFKVFTEMIDGLKSFMLKKGYESINDIIRLAVPHIDNMEEYDKFVSERQVPKELMTMAINKTGCVGCGECAESCPYGAISMKAGLPKWDFKACEFCGICSSICPVDVITIRLRAAMAK
jgi:dihydroorotate dehydrogenase/ferredoxin